MKKIIFILLALSVVTAVGYSQDPIKRRKKEKTEQPQSSEANRKREAEAKRQQDAEAKRQREAEAKRQQEAEAKRQQDAEAKRQREAEAKRQQEAEAKRQQEEEAKRQQTGVVNGHEWVDLGLPSGLKWATCNVGAATPSDYGDYFAWGETRPKSWYDRRNCFDCQDFGGNSWGVYKVGGETQITPTSGHDTARENWGGAWRMPTRAELKELSYRCTWTWTTEDGHKGYSVTGPNGNSIFLPAAGFCRGKNLYAADEIGYYWSSTLNWGLSRLATDLYFINNGHFPSDFERFFGLSVRPVIE